VAPEAEYWPAGHIVQDAAPLVLEKYPAAQFVQDDALREEYLPEGQIEHEVAPKDEKYPASQSVHELSPLGPYLPASQSEQSSGAAAHTVSVVAVH